MILVDFNHLNSRILHSSIATLRPKKKNGKYVTEDFKDFMINGILTSFGYFIKTFKEYGEIICCLEGRSWRKDSEAAGRDWRAWPHWSGNEELASQNGGAGRTDTD